jgi:hypothetical protein
LSDKSGKTLTRAKYFFIVLISTLFIFLLGETKNVKAQNDTDISIAGSAIIHQTLNSVKKIELSNIPSIGTSNFSNIVSKTKPVLESVIEDHDYVMEKLNAGNASLPDNVVEVRPPSELNASIVSNYFINPSNISKVAGIQANDSCIVSAIDEGRRVILDACNPPDIQIAPGKGHIIEMTNNFVGVWNKSDIRSNRTTLSGSNTKNPIYWTNDFFRIDRKNDTFDPFIIYDPNTGRWFSTVIEFEIPETLEQPRKYDKMGVILAYSDPDDYRKWTLMKFSPRKTYSDGTVLYVCPDRPMIYASTDKVLISMTGSDAQDNNCSEKSDTTRYLFMTVFDKKTLLDQSLLVKPFKIIYMNWRTYHYVPVRSSIDSSDINLVNIPPIVNSNSRLTYMKVNGSLDTLSCQFYERDLDYLKSLPPNALQKGTDHRILVPDNRIMDAISSDGNETWVTFHSACNIGDEPSSCIRMVKFAVEPNSISEPCLEEQASNSTNRIYEGGNRSDLSKYDTTEVVSMIKTGKLSEGVAKRVISTLINDTRTVSGVAADIGSKLNTTMRTRLNATNEGNLTSGILNMV